MTTRAPPSSDQCARAACSRLHRCGGKVLSLSSMRRSIRTSQRVRRALWYARDPRVSQPKHNGARVGPPGRATLEELSRQHRAEIEARAAKSNNSARRRNCAMRSEGEVTVENQRCPIRDLCSSPCSILRPFRVVLCRLDAGLLIRVQDVLVGPQWLPLQGGGVQMSTGPDSSRKCRSRGKIKYFV
jgi:hypothetical protein